MKSTVFNVNALSKSAKVRFGRIFNDMLKKNQGLFNETVIMCVGTDRVTGDSLGPLTGYKLCSLLPVSDTYLYGTLERPVHALNMDGFVDKIYRTHSAPLLVVVDASLGLPQHIGRLSLRHGGVVPGAGVGKRMPAIGDISVTGVVNVYGNSDHEYAVLQNTRLNTVMKMAEVISCGIISGINDYQRSV
jgi:putative sporulation protein YyaC